VNVVGMALCEVLEVVVVRLPVVEDVVVELVGEVVELPDVMK
jgi:spermidine synthase